MNGDAVHVVYAQHGVVLDAVQILMTMVERDYLVCLVQEDQAGVTQEVGAVDRHKLVMLGVVEQIRTHGVQVQTAPVMLGVFLRYIRNKQINIEVN